MTDDLVKFSIPADFITARVLLTPRELAYGYQHRWLDDRAVVQVALAALRAAREPRTVEEKLALLLSDELSRVPELLEDLVRSSPNEEHPDAVWLFLALAWLRQHRSEYPDPFEIIEMLYADFGYPEEIANLVRFVPPSPGAPTGYRALEQRWEDFVNRRSALYRDRKSRHV